MNFKYILLTSIALICSNSFAQIDPHFWRLKTPSINGRIQNTLPEVVIKSLEFNVFFDHGSRVSSWLPWSSSSTYQTEHLGGAPIKLFKNGTFQLPAIEVAAPLAIVAKRKGKSIKIEVRAKIEVDGVLLHARTSWGFSGDIDYSESLNQLVADLISLKITRSDNAYFLYHSGSGNSFYSDEITWN